MSKRARSCSMVMIEAFLICLMILLALAGFLLPFDLAFAIGFGWLRFPIRVLPIIRIDIGGLATGLICIVAFAGGLHAFLVWLYQPMREELDRRWRTRWTLAMVSVILLMFVAGLSTVGASHQIGWLMSSRVPWIEMSGGRALARSLSTNNLKQMGLAFFNYHESHNSALPQITFDSSGNSLHGWQTAALPYIEQEKLYNGINLTLRWDDPRNSASFATIVQGYINPGIRSREEQDSRGYALSHYAGNANMVRVGSARDITDGTSSTIQVGEVAAGFKPWGDPVNWRDPALGVNRSPEGFGSPFVGGANFLFADGSVRFIKSSVDPRVMKALGTPAGGEKVDQDSY